MSYDVEMAMLLKERNNVKAIGNMLGTVLSIVPLKIGTLDNTVILDNTNCFLCSTLVEKIERKATVEIKAYTVNTTTTDSRGDTTNNISVATKNDYDTVVRFKDILKVGDKVLVVADEKGQTFFVVDKVAV